jgi:lysozyme
MVNQATVDLVKQFEGLYTKSYLCPAKIWTLGYGHTDGIGPDMTCTQDQADAWLADDLAKAEQSVGALVTVSLTDNQRGALTSFVFNVGAGNLQRSTLLKLLNRGWYEQVPAQLMRWNRANGEVLGGLSRRRAAEGKLWNTAEGWA